jgi:hypothetical protein
MASTSSFDLLPLELLSLALGGPSLARLLVCRRWLAALNNRVERALAIEATLAGSRVRNAPPAGKKFGDPARGAARRVYS